MITNEIYREYLILFVYIIFLYFIFYVSITRMISRLEIEPRYKNSL